MFDPDTMAFLRAAGIWIMAGGAITLFVVPIFGYLMGRSVTIGALRARDEYRASIREQKHGKTGA